MKKSRLFSAFFIARSDRISAFDMHEPIGLAEL
jgi:hypothetical protein